MNASPTGGHLVRPITASAEHARDKRLLVLFDNFEPLWQPLAETGGP